MFKSSFKTWVYKVTVNAAINAYKKRKKYRERTAQYNDEIEVSTSSLTGEKEIEKSDNEKLINKALSILNPDQRACLVLRSIEGLSYEEIAKTLKINVNTVRTRLKRAREKIVNKFGGLS